MQKLFVALIAVTLCSVNAFSKDLAAEEAIISCSKLDTDEKKLNCFNEIAVAIEKARKDDTENNELLKNWIFARKKSPMDDSKTFIASRVGTNESGEYVAMLFLRCSENKTSAYISWVNTLDYNGDTHTVEYRIDNMKAIKSRWNLSVDNKSTFAPQGIKFAKSLSGAKKLFVRTYYYNKSPEIVAFDLDGIDGVLKELQETCSWK